MAPPKKVQLDKAAWAWCDNVDVDHAQINEDNIKSAYRLNVQKCKAGSCRRNCRGNPYCLVGLGETRWLTDHLDESEEEDNDLEIRKPNTFVGLKNLGATCYVNSLLQLWFHNLAFRQAIFLWNPLEEPEECHSSNAPVTIVGHLQLVFALMQFSKQKSIDPLAFIKALRLEPSTQQDAQEFSQLFISLLEESLKQQSNPSVRNLINNNFRGEYSYITRCSKCQKESVSPSLFCELELNVKGHKTLHESIKEFLKEEKLEGVNMYSCSECLEKQEATRFISLHKLPSVLNLQLMRFIYDRQKGHKKKLNTCIQFPDTLDMSVYLDAQNEQKSLMYNLTAVLIHKGPSAYSGHYIAHICDQTTGTWYKFNDENVEKMEGKRLILGPSDDNEDGIKKVKQPRLAKGFLASSNAYMLVYTAASEQDNKYSYSLQPHLLERVKKFNDTFDELLAETREQKKARRVNGKAHREEIAAILKTLPVNGDDDQDWEVIATSWFIHWLTNALTFVNSIDNTKLLCPHHKLHPDQVPNSKYINIKAATVLYEKYGGGPRLQGINALCKECVIRKCKSLRLRLKISEDHRDITNLLKQKEDPDVRCFWIGKRSLKVWRRKAIIKHLDREERLCAGDASAADRCIAQEYCDEGELNSHGFDNEASPHSSNEIANGFCGNNKVVSTEEMEISAPYVPDSSADTTTTSNSVSQQSSLRSLFDSIDHQITDIKNKWNVNINEDKLNEDMLIDFKSVRDLLNALCSGTITDSVSNEVSSVCNTPSLVCDSSTTNSNLKVLDNGDCLIKNDKQCDSDTKENSLKRKRCDLDPKDTSDNCDDNKILKSDEEDDDQEEFNEDIKCIHGNLIHEETSRRLVSEQIWSMLKWYFPECTEYPKGTLPCEVCQRTAAHGLEAMDLHKQQAQTQKNLLPSLLSGKSRPKFVDGTFHVISVEDFLKPWRKFIREAGRMEPLCSLRNTRLICMHGDLVYSLHEEEDSTTVAPVSDDEWYILCMCYSVDMDITVTYDPNGELIDTNPKVCQECILQRLENEQKALLQYDKAKLYIRQISNKGSTEEAQHRNRSPSPRLEGKNKSVPSTNSNQVQVQSIGDSNAGSSSSSSSNAVQSESIRRSTRLRRVRGEKGVTVSSNETLRDLKLKILNVLHVAPFDQHLSTEDGRMLVDPSATLASLNIFPNSVLLLRVDEPIDDTETPDDYIRTSEPEEGFKGTVLLKR